MFPNVPSYTVGFVDFSVRSYPYFRWRSYWYT